MSSNSAIEWTDRTWNPVSGCTRASEGCDNCYAVKMTYRLEGMGQAEKYGGLTVLNGKGDRHFNGVVRTHDDALKIPLGWKKPTRVFVNSMSDLFHKDVPFDFIDKAQAVMALTPQHTYQILTKRPEIMADYTLSRTAIDDSGSYDRMPQWYQVVTKWLDDSYGGGRFFESEKQWETAHEAAESRDLSHTLSNVWLGTSCENQQAADDRIPHLLKCPAAVRFLSCEPLLGPIDLERPRPGPDLDQGGGSKICQPWIIQSGISWVIVGGESGHGARPLNVDWVRSIVRQCKNAGVACFVKQLGAHPYDPSWHGDGTPDGSKMRLNDSKGGDMEEWSSDLRVREFPSVSTLSPTP